jgi:anti-sigma B factor antagonist
MHTVSTDHIPGHPFGLSISHAPSEDRYVVSLEGELEIATCPRLRRELLEVKATGAQTIVLDISQLDFIDSTGVQFLLEVTYKAGYGAPSTVLLTRTSENIRRLLQIAGVEEQLPFVD